MNDKQLVAHYAAAQIKNGMVVGLGTGSTANYFIAELARRQNEENLKISTVSSSVASAYEAKKYGLPLLDFENVNALDVYVDGADEVSPDLSLLKGQGADLVREKLLATASKEFVVLVDSSKSVERIGQNFAIPIEVMPFAWQLVKKQLEIHGGQGDLRKNADKTGLASSSYGSLILDMRFDARMDAKQLNDILNSISGIVEHGIFYALATSVLIGKAGQIQILQAQ